MLKAVEKNKLKDDLIKVFEEYKQRNKDYLDEHSRWFKETNSMVFPHFKQMSDELSEYERIHASKYNIFMILSNLIKKEVITHSPFIADLLRVNGGHQQKDLFYKEFLRRLEIGDEFIPDYPELLNVDLEYSTDDGRIDILVSYFDGSKRFAIAIENKINAEDQPKQLERYNDYLEKTYDKYVLIYLTPTGKRPSIPYSIEKKTYDKLVNTNKLFLASYSKDIAGLIDSTIQQIETPIIKSIVGQYSEIIKMI